MDNLYLGLIVFIFILAIFDLIVGVSNDAVNFLNSAIGAKVATFRTIIIIASIGIICGASMSGGMMEIARHGIFRPEMFTFKELMAIFLAVMVSDIFLLDIFNSLGMPTSTTVSMVFELLGGTFAIAILKMISDETGSLEISGLMNTGKALSMIIAIFISVAIAFVFGTVVQFLTRIIFTFNYKRNLKWKIGLFGGISATAIVYFMLIKGIGTFAFVSKETMDFINGNAPMIAGVCLVFFTILSQVLYALKINVFKIIVLMGTFALAMAFAGNDLVNFIGVPLTGYSSYIDFAANSNTDAAHYFMGVLNTTEKPGAIFLFGAGLVMIISLATSKKARNVVKTSVDLSRQASGDEMFGSSKIARVLVRTSSNLAGTLAENVPLSVRKWIDDRFLAPEIPAKDGAAFDEIRACVNLVVASLLIALGTSLQLPLSTTYVTFMVAMGSSLADRAWGRESAVFRITGVLSVIGGWFITAGAAFILCFVVSLMMYFGGATIQITIVLLTLFLLLRSSIRYSRRKAEGSSDELFDKMMDSNDKLETLALLEQHIDKSQTDFLEFATTSYSQITDGFVNENLSLLSKAENSMRQRRIELKNTRRKEIIGLRKINHVKALEINTWFHLGKNSCEDILYCLRRICDSCQEHVDNNFAPLGKERIKEFLPLRDTMLFLLRRTEKLIENNEYSDEADVLRGFGQLKECLVETKEGMMVRMQSTQDNITVSYVYMNMLQETLQLLNCLGQLLEAQKNLKIFGKTEPVIETTAAR